MTDATQPVIGIVPSFDNGALIAGGHEVKRVFLRRDYLESIAQVGAIPLILSPEMSTESIIQLCDGIVISGGYDIDPVRYGEVALPAVRLLEPAERYEWEEALINACDKAHTPILGICYGLQRLNIHYGGSLIQDIPQEIGDAVLHDNVEHEVTFSRDFLGIGANERRQVASRHHQAIGRLGDNIAVCAKSSDGIIEAARIGEIHFGMQWHPESDATGVRVYRTFIESCMKA